MGVFRSFQIWKVNCDGAGDHAPALTSFHAAWIGDQSDNLIIATAGSDHKIRVRTNCTQTRQKAATTEHHTTSGILIY